MESTPLKIYSRYERPDIAGLTFPSPSYTQQHHAKSCDINYIAAQYERGVAMPIMVNEQNAHYFDTTQFGDFTEAMNRQLEVRKIFDSLSAVDRARFNNDLGTYMDFMCDPKNAEIALELGFIEAVDSTASVMQGLETAPQSGDDSES